MGVSSFVVGICWARSGSDPSSQLKRSVGTRFAGCDSAPAAPYIGPMPRPPRDTSRPRVPRPSSVSPTRPRSRAPRAASPASRRPPRPRPARHAGDQALRGRRQGLRRGAADVVRRRHPGRALHPAGPAQHGPALAQHREHDGQPQRAARQAARALRARARGAGRAADDRRPSARLGQPADVHAAPAAAPGEERRRRRLQAGVGVRAEGRPAHRHRRAGGGRRASTSATRCCSASPARARPSPWPRSSRRPSARR